MFQQGKDEPGAARDWPAESISPALFLHLCPPEPTEFEERRTIMVAKAQAGGQSLRINAEDVRDRFTAQEPVTVLDVRAEKAWNGSDLKVAGAIRVGPDDFQADPSWPKDRLTVAYCT
jgi:hypothetical protein